jgi:hypothetical protein
VRPEATDIAIPPLPADLRWIGEAPPARIERLAAQRPILVHFFDFAQLNSARTLPYLRRWHERYAPLGLAVLGVHTPRYPFTAPEDAVAAAVDRLGIGYPVAVDMGFRAWRSYGCEGWPSLFVWGVGGALRWFHLGEGKYLATEGAIAGVIREARPESPLPDPLPPLRPTDAEGALVRPPTEELFPGGSVAEPWDPGGAGAELVLEYGAGGAYVAADGEGSVEHAIDGREREPIAVDHPGLFELASHPRHEEHRLAVRPTSGVRVWAISFAAGVP